MTDQQENNQILTQQMQTIYPASNEFENAEIPSADSLSAASENKAEIPPIDNDLTPTPLAIENPAEIPQIDNDLTPAPLPTENPAEISPIENDLTAAPAENIADIAPSENDLTSTTAPADTIPESDRIEGRSPEIYPAEIVETPANNTPEISQIVTDDRPSDRTVNPEPQPTRIWQLLLVFFSGMLVGSVLSLGTLLAWRMYQERANIQIKLPADVPLPLPASPSPTVTVPARQLPGIPPAPSTVSPLPANNPSPNPTQVPSLSGVPQLASPPPQPSPDASVVPSASPFPAAETAVTDRVNFEAGATGTTLTNTLPDNKSKRYLIDCQGGQTMTLNVPEGAVSATIIAPNGEKIGTANNTTPWEGQLPSSGDYTIEISGESQANYGVKI
ncbi:MAG: hypothetical protein ACRC62_22080, partial [Microcoleus sp.]